MNQYLPESGKASTYSDYFEGRKTSSGEIYRHQGFTAAVMPRERWKKVPLGLRVRLTCGGRSVVVKINDRGKGDGSLERVLDLSRAAMSRLVGRELETERDARDAGVIQLDRIEEVPGATPLG